MKMSQNYVITIKIHLFTDTLNQLKQFYETITCYFNLCIYC